jgi:hypothetical protein
LLSAQRGIMIRETPVSVYVDGVEVGYGSIVYVDESATQLLPTTKLSCSTTMAYIDDEAVPLRFCWSDTVAGLFSGVVRRAINVPVYIGEVEVGKASIEVVDSFGMSSTMFILLLLPIMAILYIVSSTVKRLRGRA